MNKILRFLVILIIILFVGYLVLCATSASEIKVQSDTNINAPEELVWTQMSHFKYWDNWSPWKEADSTVNSVIEGPSGQPGNTSSWTSKESGTGNMKIESVEGHKMNYSMNFIEPFESTATGWVSTESGENGTTKASWGFSTKPSFMERGFFALFMTKQLQANFDRGLELLKEHCESGKAQVEYDIMEVTFPATTFATIRKTIPMSEMMSFYETSRNALMEAVGDMKAGNPMGIFYSWEEEKGQTDMAIALPVSGPVKGMEMEEVPECKAYTIKMNGGYGQSYNAHMQLYGRLAKENKEAKGTIEEYVVGPHNETDTSKFVTSIYYLID
ncbi:MAG: SRPBCC family protein [Chitinophagales bacterium]|nr:SRPBCC family protein [Chitinophagaceae bacterium]MCB9065165.1 SRPBCC family protein [Chitinophagales bacterium]